MITRVIRFVRRHFGRREWAALLGSLILITLVLWLSGRTDNLEDLGYVGGFLAMLLGSATVILPAPGLAVVAALGATVPSPLLLGIVAGIGAALGETTGYLAGWGGHKIMEEQKYFAKLDAFVEKRGFVAIATLAFIPNPLFDVVGIIAGSTKYPFGLFMSATLIGKTAKCVLVAYAGATAFGWLFG